MFGLWISFQKGFRIVFRNNDTVKLEIITDKIFRVVKRDKEMKVLWRRGVKMTPVGSSPFRPSPDEVSAKQLPGRFSQSIELQIAPMSIDLGAVNLAHPAVIVSLNYWCLLWTSRYVRYTRNTCFLTPVQLTNAIYYRARSVAINSLDHLSTTRNSVIYHVQI